MARPAKAVHQVYNFLVDQAMEAITPLDEVNLTVAEVASKLGWTRRTVTETLNQLSQDGRVIERKPRKIRIRLPDGRGGGTGRVRGVHLAGQDLRGYNLQGANLYGADLKNADLRGANLRDAKLSHADLTGADLEGTSLRNAQAAWADFSGSNLNNVDAVGTVMTRVNLTGAVVKQMKIGTPLTQHSLWGKPHSQLK